MSNIRNKPNFFRMLERFVRKLRYRTVQKVELQWWQKKGLTKGTKHYALYHKIFKFDEYDFSKSIFIDVGGGMFPIHLPFKCKRKILIDPLIESYAKIKGYQLSDEVEYYKSFDQLLPQQSMADVISCLNTLDHAFDPDELVQQIHNSMQKNGLLFVYSHIGNPLGGTQHPHCLLKEDYLSMIQGRFRIIKDFDLTHKEFEKVNRYPAFAAICTKED